MGNSFAQEPTMAGGVNQSALDVKVERAFPNLTIERPVVITHAGDGSNRLFVAAQKGQIYSFANNQTVKRADLFFDLSENVTYKDNENEEGLLGLAFHPQFESTHEFFLYYTTTAEPHLSIISRFKTLPDNPGKGDPASEEVLMKIKQPFWNHNGGTLEFGKDGMLYIALGDGGKADDPLKSAQDLSTWLGKILRIDVNNADPGLPYSIPKDNPFVNRTGARPEIYALGVRNPWRISFDRQTGDLWCADVGQNLWEEISLVTKGGNYGWSDREATHPFGPTAKEANSAMVEPIWEYPHTDAWGKSITGGQVYRGTRVSKLQGYYLYGDYVTGKLWALKYDARTGKVTENRTIAWPPSLPVVTYGEDEEGDVYFTTVTSGGMIFRYAD